MKKTTEMKQITVIIFLLSLLVLFSFFYQSEALAVVLKSGFENKMTHLQHKLSSFILPVMSVLGLVMAGILAAIGNEGAKSKIWFCLIGSGVGFLAPYIIGWLQGVLN